MTIVSIDIEADGPIPEQNSMLALGAVAFTNDGIELGEFYRKLYPLADAVQNPMTMTWWQTQSAAWKEATYNQEPALDVMSDYAKWFLSFKYPVMLAAPSGFDFTFVRYYLCKFIGVNWKWHNCIDLRSFLMMKRGKYHGSYKKGLKIKHTHIAVEDAREQAQYFFAAWRECEHTISTT